MHYFVLIFEQVPGSPGVQCQDFRSIPALHWNKGPPAVPGDREEDPARTGPRIRLRPGSGTRHRYGGTGPPPVAGGHDAHVRIQTGNLIS